MAVLSFESDYTQGAHEKVLAKLIETNMEKLVGYGEDIYCDAAKAKIKEACASPDSDVFLLTGGTQTNQLVIASMLDTHEGVIAAETGHINGHEAGAIEYTGHKVLPISHTDGKIHIDALRELLVTFYNDKNHDHQVFPAMLYISHPTEYGTLYTKDELTRISEICHEYGLYLFLDGARLGYGLMSKGTDVTLPLLAELCDVFYIGGTKVGALCGEAVVFKKSATPRHFFTKIKQHGALIAKGRLLGVQFDALFTDNLYFEISRNAIEKADRMKALFASLGFKFFIDSPTNQIFVVLENGFYDKLSESVRVGFWEKYDDNHTVVRFATSWATTDEDVDALEKVLCTLMAK